jgi:hypothetical protein
MTDKLPDLGDMIFGIAALFSALIVTFEWLERRRDGDRERRLLDSIEREYEAYRRMGHF